MANPLTGDFEAVLQVSGATVNRLLASMHQNAGTSSETPSFPHVMRMRIGDPDPIDGIRGSIAGQISVPRIDLIHGVSDKFWLEVAIRARYTPDPGSVPMPEFIHGTVRAQYRIDTIDPSCWGWEKIAGDYIWTRVVPDTVSFTGTAVDDISIVSAAQAAIDPSVADARITTVVRHLLATRFQATPHKVSKRFRRGAMRSLNPGANASLVAVPIGLSGDPSAGKIDSINQNILDGKDVAIGINRDFIMKRINEALQELKSSFEIKYGIRHKSYIAGYKALEVNIDWTVTLTNASAQWIGGMPPVLGFSLPGGLVSLTLTGQAWTPNPIFRFGFDVTQLVMITFDAATEQFAAAPFGTANINLTGVLAPFVEGEAKPRLQNALDSTMKSAASGMTGELSLKDRKDDLVKQLQTMDANAGVSFTSAQFTADGVAIRGNIMLSARRAAEVIVNFTAAKDGYSAYQSWIPGGRIDSFNWSWKWFNNAGKPGFETETDRYVLRRPPGKGWGKYGMVVGLQSPLPGLDGMGQVCLVVSGERVHPVTGQPVQINVSRKCKRFGFDLSLATPDRLFLREWTPGPRDPMGPVAETAIHQLNSRSPGHGANTLIVRAGNGWNSEAARALQSGLADSHRRDAGLVVLVLFNDGELMQAQPETLERFRALAAELEAPLVVNEDVEGSWSRALRINGSDRLEWRLVSPNGGVTWAHSGELASRDLAAALDTYLFRSRVAGVSQVMDGLPVGTQISPYAFESDVVGRLSRLDEACPPPPFNRLGMESAVTFIKKNSAASEAALRETTSREEREEAESFRIIVIDGGTTEDAERLRDSARDVMVVADPDGDIARRFGIRSWPSSLRINGSGSLSAGEVEDHE